MTKKIFAVILVSAILSLCCGFCFAASNETESVGLGNEISSSLDKSASTIGNVADDMVDVGEGALQDVGNTMGDWDNNQNNNNQNNNGMWNNNQATDGYNTTRTTTEGTESTSGAMSTTTWMWIIFAIAAVVIIAAIWYYAMQGNGKD